ncbi:MAG TPA: PIN domain-containing protein [Steroidobacteraceae bacterium]
MSGADSFLDTNVLLYLLSEDAEKAERVEELLLRPNVISVQVLNEFAVVATRKLALSFEEAREVLETIRAACAVEPLTVETHDRGLEVAERLRLSIYDAMIVASALKAGCRTLYTEDLQHQQLISRQLRVVNPFVNA